MRPILLAVLLPVVAGCSDQTAGVSPSVTPDFNINSPPATARTITVMTQNLYVGADVDLVIKALGTSDPSDDFPALLFAIQTVGKTGFPARAEAIADEIARARPHAVGLQEVSQIDIDLHLLGGPTLKQDFFTILRDALSRRRLPYKVVAHVTNTSVSLVSGLVNLVDNDALLIDTSRVTVDAAQGQNFAVNLGPVAPGVTLIRGWVWARTRVDGQSYTFASAHTEANLAGAPPGLPGLLAQIRAAQVGEIVATLATDQRVVLIGDLNDTPGSPMYGALQRGGFTDGWAALHPGASGLTCCHVADLSDPVANFDQRIDYIWTRGLGKGAKLQGSIDRFGNVPADRVAGPEYRIWPSDHAGLLAALAFPT